MSIIKTAVSLPEPLFEQAEALASRLNVSRSRLVALALEAYIDRHENQQLLGQLNQAYENAPDAVEQVRLRQMRRVHRQVVEGEW
jgi:metal-responsive CopG/Arc/MetJ family transcriptional regulator